MSFIDSYKHLENLCGEILNDDSRLSAYIDEMINTPSGNHYVRNWNDNLKTLKHYRWVRNQISHKLGCNEQSSIKTKTPLFRNNIMGNYSSYIILLVLKQIKLNGCNLLNKELRLHPFLCFSTRPLKTVLLAS